MTVTGIFLSDVFTVTDFPPIITNNIIWWYSKVHFSFISTSYLAHFAKWSSSTQTEPVFLAFRHQTVLALNWCCMLYDLWFCKLPSFMFHHLTCNWHSSSYCWEYKMNNLFF
jgi:hypothetical protein